MSDNPFHRLSPFIQEYIYAHQWQELRAVQVEACRVIFDEDGHLLLATGTASGKTEAAFLPVLTLLHSAPASSVAVLYIGPLKALINDQFVRLNDLLKEANIPVWHWHGDVGQGEKHRLLKEPRGVLQITPESLESLLINKTCELGRLFSDLRFVIIDEVHAFMGSDRGRQVICQLQRLSKFFRQQPRRIGLSATLGDPSFAEEWLRSGTNRPVITPKISGGARKIRLSVEQFMEGDSEVVDGAQYYRYIYDLTRNRKCLIFTNSRADAESVISSLRQIAEAERSPDIYHVHHGSIAAPLREAAEDAMRDPVMPAVTAATVTLELGIDIGQLERIVQLSAPFSVSSFVQRLGRSGRRGQPSEMRFVCKEGPVSGEDEFPRQIPWQLLQAIAIIQLYLEERWIEPIPPVKYPFSLLYHQTMSTLAGVGELSPAALAQRVLLLPPFENISEDDFQDLLLHLISIDHIQRTEERGLIIGLTGERVVRDYRFYAVFSDNPEYTVSERSRQIGTIVEPPPPGERFALAGRTWEVVEMDAKRRTVQAKQVKGRVIAFWHGAGGSVHSKVLRRIREVLFEDSVYSYLQPRAVERLSEARNLVRKMGLDKRTVLPLTEHSYCVFPWMGTVAFRTLERSLRLIKGDRLGIRGLEAYTPYFMTIRVTRNGSEELERGLRDLAHDPLSPESLAPQGEAPEFEKYDEFIPFHLLKKAFVADHLDVTEMQSLLSL